MASDEIVFVRSAADAAALFAPRLAGAGRERLLVAHLDADRRLLGLIEMPEGKPDEVVLRTRRILTDALRLGGRGIVLAHNHPSGDPAPSEADRSVTRRLAETAAALGIALHDHLIFAGEDCRSLRAMGLL